MTMRHFYSLFIFLFIAFFSVENSYSTGFKIKDKLGFISNEGQLQNRNVLYYLKRENLTVHFYNSGKVTYTVNGTIHNQTYKETIELKFNNCNMVTPVSAGENSNRILFRKGNADYHVEDHTKLMFSNIYNNIDLVYYLNDNGGLKYDFIVHPGGNPDDISVAYEGGVSKQVFNEEFLIETNLGTVKEHRPYSYQANNKEVKSNYKLSGNTLSLNLGAYDPDKKLIIDPEIDMLSSIGGTNDDFVEDIITDDEGNIYVAGHTNSDNAPVLNAAQPAKAAFKDAYIAKLNSEGSLIWATFYGGSENDIATGITLGDNNNVYITGYTESTNFPVTGSGSNINKGGNDLFVVKLSEGGAVLNSSLFGGDSDDEGSDIEIDEAGNVYVLGSTASEYFPSDNPIQGSGSDIILMKLDQNLGFIYTSYLGGNTGDEGLELMLDNNGSPIITGVSTSDSGFISQENVFQNEFGGVEDGFLVKLNKSDGTLNWGTYLGGTGVDYGQAITVDANNNYYVAGYTLSSDFPVKNAYQSSLSGSNDGFVSKFDSSGSLIWSTYAGGSNADDISGIVADKFNNVYLLGSTESSDLPLEGDQILQNNLAGGYDIFIEALNSNGELIYSTYYGGSDNDFGMALDFSSTSKLYVAGHSESSTISTENFNNAGGLDYMVSIIDVSDLQDQTLDSNNHITITDSTSCTNTFVELKGTDINDIFSNVNISYQYQHADLNGSWMNVVDSSGNDNGTNNDYRQLLTTPGTYYYRRIAYNSDSSLVSVSNIDSIEVVSESITDNVIEFENGNTVSLNQCQTNPDTIHITGSTASSSSGSVDYQYVIFDEEINDYRNISGADSVNFQFYPDTTAGNYTIGRLAISENNPKCFDLATVEISIDSQLVANNNIESDFEYVCEGTSATINGSEPTVEFDSYSYQYYDSIPGGNWEIIPGADAKSLSYSLNENDTVYISREVILENSGNSCLNFSNVLELTGDTLAPEASFTFSTANDSLCVGNEIVFQASDDYTSPRDSIVAFNYDFGGLYSANTSDTSVVFSEGVYEILLETTAQNGCINDTVVEITVNPVPDVDAGEDRVLQDDSIQLDATTNATNLDSLYWQPQEGLSENDILNPLVGVSKTTSYEITVVNEFGCQASDSVTVFVVSDTLLDTTNVITINSEPACLDSRIIIEGSDLETITGVEGFAYQYQDSTSGGTWTDSEDPLGQNDGTQVDFVETASGSGIIYYRRIVTGPEDVYTDTSNIVPVEIVNQNISDNTLLFEDGSIDYSQCEDDNSPINIIGSVASAATGDVNYQYAIFDSVSNEYIDIPGADEKDYMFNLDSSAGTYTIARYAISTLNPTCFDLDTIDLVIDPQLVEGENAISVDTNVVCSNSEIFIDGSEINIDSSLYNIVYYDSIPGAGWNLIPESDEEDLTYNINEADTVYIQRVIQPNDSGNSCLNYSNILELTSGENEPEFTVSVQPVKGGLCAGNLVSFSIEVPDNNSYIYQWEFDNQTETTDSDSTTKIFSAGDHSVFVSAESEIGCVSDTTLNFTIYNNPVVDAGDDIYLNEEESPKILATSSSTILDSIRWNPTDGLSDPTVLQPEIVIPNTETYVVTVTDTNVCQGSDTVEVVKLSCEEIAASNAIEVNNNTKCLNETLKLLGSNLSDSLNSTGFSYQYQDSVPNGSWSDLEAPGSESGPAYNYTVNTLSPGIIYYRRIVTSPNDLCNDTSDFISVEIIDQAVSNNEILFNGTDEEYTQCEESSGLIEISGTDALVNSGSVNYKYAIYNDNLNEFVEIPNQTNKDLSIEIDTVAGTYYIGRYAISAENPQCKAIDSITLEIDPQLVDSNIINTSSLLVCENTEATIKGNEPNLSETFEYVYYDSIPNGSWSTIGNTQDIEYQLNQDTVYIVREVVLPNANNTCTSFSNVLELVKDSSYPVAVFEYTSEAEALCAGSLISFTETTPESDSITNWNWDFAEIASSNSADTSLTFEEGTYDITLEVTSKSGCTDDTTVNIEVYPSPDINIETGDEITLSEEEEVQLQVDVTNGEAEQAVWTPAMGLSDPNTLEPMVSVTGNELYTVEVSDTNGCKASDSIQVNFLDEFLIPTAFTPNGDGYNDDFEIVGIDDYPEASMAIYNRWTVRVFQSEDLENNRWDGTYKGNSQPAGVYYYVLDLNNGSEVIEGSITILK